MLLLNSSSGIFIIIIFIIIIRITILQDFDIFKAQTGYNRIGDQSVGSESLGCPKKRRETFLIQQKKAPLTNHGLESNTALGDAGTKQYRDKTLSMRCVSFITIVLSFFFNFCDTCCSYLKKTLMLVKKKFNSLTASKILEHFFFNCVCNQFPFSMLSVRGSNCGELKRGE